MKQTNLDGEKNKKLNRHTPCRRLKLISHKLLTSQGDITSLTWLQPSILVEFIMHQIQKSHVGKLSAFIFTGVCTGTCWTCVMAHKETP